MRGPRAVRRPADTRSQAGGWARLLSQMATALRIRASIGASRFGSAQASEHHKSPGTSFAWAFAFLRQLLQLTPVPQRPLALPFGIGEVRVSLAAPFLGGICPRRQNPAHLTSRVLHSHQRRYIRMPEQIQSGCPVAASPASGRFSYRPKRAEHLRTLPRHEKRFPRICRQVAVSLIGGAGIYWRFLVRGGFAQIFLTSKLKKCTMPQRTWAASEVTARIHGDLLTAIQTAPLDYTTFGVKCIPFAEQNSMIERARMKMLVPIWPKSAPKAPHFGC